MHEGMGRYEDYGENFYYFQEDFMFELAAKRKWDWNIIRPNAIIGFTPAGEPYISCSIFYFFAQVAIH